MLVRCRCTHYSIGRTSKGAIGVDADSVRFTVVSVIGTLIVISASKSISGVAAITDASKSTVCISASSMLIAVIDTSCTFIIIGASDSVAAATTIVSAMKALSVLKQVALASQFSLLCAHS